jgi:hypothetical protein
MKSVQLLIQQYLLYNRQVIEFRKGITVYNREKRIENLEFIYEVLFVLILMPFIFAAMTQVFDDFFFAYLCTAFISMWLFGLSWFLNKNVFRPLIHKIIKKAVN